MYSSCKYPLIFTRFPHWSRIFTLPTIRFCRILLNQNFLLMLRNPPSPDHLGNTNISHCRCLTAVFQFCRASLPSSILHSLGTHRLCANNCKPNQREISHLCKTTAHEVTFSISSDKLGRESHNPASFPTVSRHRSSVFSSSNVWVQV